MLVDRPFPRVCVHAFWQAAARFHLATCRMLSGCSSSDGEQDLDVDGLGVPASALSDTESSGSDGHNSSAGIDLPTLLEHVDLALRPPVQRAPRRAVACHIAHKDATVNVTHAGLLGQQ